MSKPVINWYNQLSLSHQLIVNLIARSIQFYLVLLLIDFVSKENIRHVLWIRLVAVLTGGLLMTLFLDPTKIKLLIKRHDGQQG
jgi:hypothetical protein